MDLGSILLGLALVVVVVFVIAQPLLEQTNRRAQPATPAEALLNARERVLGQLRDLDFDNATGKVNANDYAALRAKLVAEGVTILKQLDALGVSGEGDETSPAAPDEAIEAAIAQRRARAASSAPVGQTKAATGRTRARRTTSRPAGAALKNTPAPAKVVPSQAWPKSNGRDVDAEIEANIAQRRSKTPGSAEAAAEADALCCGK